MIEFQKTYTTPEQSKRLLELGVPADSADCYYLDLGLNEYSDRPYLGFNADEFPCWSVGRLIEICLKCSTLEQRQVRFFCNGDRDEYSIIDFTIAVLESGITTNQMDFSKLEENK